MIRQAQQIVEDSAIIIELPFHVFFTMICSSIYIDIKLIVIGPTQHMITVLLGHVVKERIS